MAVNTAIAIFGSGVAGPPTIAGAAPGDVTAIVVTGFIDPVSAAITLTVAITPPATLGTFIGCHVYLEVPDQSATPAQVVGSSVLGSGAVTGPWAPIDCGRQVYVASQQPWTISGIPAPASIDPTVDTPARVYCVAFSTSQENKLVQANQSSPSPNQTFSLVSLASGSPTSGTNITGLTTITGAQVGIVATALAPQNVSGKLVTPIEVIVTDIGTPVGWCYELVLTYAGSDPTQTVNQFVMSTVQTQAGQVVAPADGVSIPHSFLIPTPTAVTEATVWLLAGLMVGGVFTPNNLVPGITPQFGITFGSTVGTTDASAIMTATIAASMAVVSGLFGVAAAGITNPLLGTAAVGTINVQALAITNPLLASLAVQASNLATGSVTATAIAALAVGTGAIQTAAITNALIANLAVDAAQIVSATITGAQIASATIAGANIGTATIAQANLASLSVGTAQIQSAAITGAKIGSATITSANISTCSVASLIAGTATFTSTVTFAMSGGVSMVLTSGSLTITATGASQPTVIDAVGILMENLAVTGSLEFLLGYGAIPIATSASAGSASALPSNPVGYIEFSDGTYPNRKIPYYAN